MIYGLGVRGEGREREEARFRITYVNSSIAILHRCLMTWELTSSRRHLKVTMPVFLHMVKLVRENHTA